MAYPFLSMDGSGFIHEPSLKVDAILASYAATQYSQSVIYRDIISSLSKDLQRCSQQWDKLAGIVEGSLDRLFNAYFDQVEINVVLDEESMNADTSTFKLFIMGTVAQDGKPYDLSKMLQISNSKFSSVTDFGLGNKQYA